MLLLFAISLQSALLLDVKTGVDAELASLKHSPQFLTGMILIYWKDFLKRVYPSIVHLPEDWCCFQAEP